MFGKQRLLVIALAAVSAGTLISAIAHSLDVMLVGRVVQGLGAALLVPQSLAIIAASFPRGVRGKAIGAWAAASAVTMALGPPIGVLLVDALSWRAAFWVNLPLSAAALWLRLSQLPPRWRCSSACPAADTSA